MTLNPSIYDDISKRESRQWKRDKSVNELVDQIIRSDTNALKEDVKKDLKVSLIREVPNENTKNKSDKDQSGAHIKAKIMGICMAVFSGTC